MSIKWLAILIATWPTVSSDASAQERPAMRQAARPLPPAATSVFASRRAGDEALSSLHGGSGVASETTLGGVVLDNQAINVTTGGNLITGGAFAGASGVPVVIQNSGNNVLIQSATIVNLQVK